MKILFDICEERNQQVQVNAVDKWGRTPLRLCLLRGDKIEMIELLLRNGANSNLVDARGLTPLQIICQTHEWVTQRGHNLEMTIDSVRHLMELLLRNNANPNLANEEGFTILHMICENDRGHYFVEIFFKVCEELNQLVQVNAQDKSGNTPLHVAVKYDHMKTPRLLLKKSGREYSRCKWVDSSARFLPEMQSHRWPNDRAIFRGKRGTG
ncbi:serine/threonine-protein phosphatase 6 regulatory ankyrin repeat subunit C-like [Trichogramma pretiosum]|uniref:serine/threonine-protein phosphatase 6 regulatory ankyrin repeat subunit C-like n=1 Tax=Trichogramma pretiosum TaxID=7493 RepID=UPI0006C98C8B|nr:serine/threonine-protein phosphatase 6 regulatory ankyrin repeat subunit C-like [Trichogramma pretiosum]